MAERNWMYLENRTSDDYLNDVLAFNALAEQHMKQMETRVMFCPCMDCQNEKKFAHSMHLHAHLIVRGFKENYKIWNKHGEQGLNPNETVHRVGDDSADQCHLSTSTGVPHLTDEDIISIDEDYAADLVDNVDQMVRDAEGNDEFEYSQGEFAKFQGLLRDLKKPLYPSSQSF